MRRSLRLLAASLWITCGLAPSLHAALRSKAAHPRQETGFLNRKLQYNGATYRYQVYVPEEWRPDDRRAWPILLFLHGRGERGSEGMWQTQIGLPEAIRDHPERWPFIVVMPQCAQDQYWTDHEMLTVAMMSLDQETAEFRADPARTYLSGLSMGGYGAWELARLHPTRWAAVAIAAGGIFWSYAPQRWAQSGVLPGEYAQAVGRLPIWLFHGSEDNIVVPRQSELMYSALKASGGSVRLWVYLGLHHDCWSRAYLEPELPRWLLAHRREPHHAATPIAERISIPLHPPAIKLAPPQFDSLLGDYVDAHGILAVTLFRQGDDLFQRNRYGEVAELAAESPGTLFYPNGASYFTRILIERDPQGRVTSLLLRDDRHQERWERIRTGLRTPSQPE